MSLMFLATKEALDLNAISEELIFVFTTTVGSKFATSQQPFLDALKSELGQNSAKVFFVTKEEGATESQDFLFDAEGEIINLSPVIKKDKPGDNLLIFRLKSGILEYLETKEQPEASSNWIEAVLDYSKNYQIAEPDAENYFRWGQKVAQDGEYLCKDCGYILELKEGQVFPICEVCLSGEPTGPAGPKDGYWELI